MKTKPAKLKVMHKLSKDGNGQPTIHSTVSNPPKLKETVDVQQAAEETGHKIPKTVSKTDMTDEQRSLLKALHDLVGKDVHSMDIAKKLGFDKTHKDAARAPVRNAMERLHSLHFVTSKKVGAKYAYSITDKGVEALKKPANPTAPKDKEAGSMVKPAASKPPASDLSPTPTVFERPANTDIECRKCPRSIHSERSTARNVGQRFKSLRPRQLRPELLFST
ncbi:MAG TPA: hypothetical protein VFE98_00670 [Candidatus Bathyarchaeia archaeon]|nr:hypothetical protein [Candidatus Bathyarchaeia archaeon]